MFFYVFTLICCCTLQEGFKVTLICCCTLQDGFKVTSIGGCTLQEGFKVTLIGPCTLQEGFKVICHFLPKEIIFKCFCAVVAAFCRTRRFPNHSCYFHNLLILWV